jgi:hypothetical protein
MRALRSVVALTALYGCYDYTLPDAPPESPDASIPHDAGLVRDVDVAPPIDAAEASAPACADTCNGNLLERCQADGGLAVAMKCANGCESAACAAPTACVTNGTYCGGDKVNGDPNVLYKCGTDGIATTVAEACANGCFVAAPGTDDHCN